MNNEIYYQLENARTEAIKNAKAALKLAEKLNIKLK